MKYLVYRLSDGFVESVAICNESSQPSVQEGVTAALAVENEVDGRTHRVVDGEAVEYTSEQQDLLKTPRGRGWIWNALSCEWVDTRPIEQVKAQKWEEIKRARTQAEYSPLTVNGYEYDADSESQQKITGAVNLAVLAGEGFSIDWTLRTNTVVTLNQAGMIAVGVGLGQRTSSIYGYARTLREQIEAATTIEEVEAVNW